MVIPTGYSFNLDGTCIYLTHGRAVHRAGVRPGHGDRRADRPGLIILTSKGAAGITGAGLVTLTASLQAFGGTFFSAEAIAVGIALVVGIDRIMSEGRALTNAIGNSVATLAIARWQGELDRDRLHTVLDRPEIVDRDVEAALRGAGTADDQDRPAARFERDLGTGAHVVGVGGDADRRA